MKSSKLMKNLFKISKSNYSARSFNFSAGPATLDNDVMDKIQQEFQNYNNTGKSIIESSHREIGGPVRTVISECRERIRHMLDIPDNYSILFMHGGAHLQFSAVTQNLKRKSLNNNSFGAYINTGYWSDRAIEEANKFINTKTLAHAKDSNFTKLPTFNDFNDDIMEQVDNMDYIHICANETIYGLEYHYDMDVEKLFKNHDYIPPLVGDFTSTLFSRPVDVDKYGVIYASAGKNFGPAGVTIVIARNDLIQDEDRGMDPIPGIMDYNNFCDPIHDELTLYNTPPVFQIYTTNLVLQQLQEDFGDSLENVKKWQTNRVKELYSIIDEYDMLYQNNVLDSDRSLMNVPFRILNKETGKPDIELENKFTEMAEHSYGMYQVNGHHLFGGQRITCYNPVTDRALNCIKKFMTQFALDNLQKNIN